MFRSDPRSTKAIGKRLAAIEVALLCALAVVYASAELAGVPKRWIISGLVVALFSYGIEIWRRGQEQ